MNAKLLPLLSLLAIPVLTGCEEQPSWAEASLGRNVTAPAQVALAEQTKQLEASKSAAPAATPVTIDAPSKVIDAPEPPDIDRDAPLKVKRLVVAESVEKREPVAAGVSFGDDTPRIYAFVEIGNPERAESEVAISITPRGEKERGRVTLKVGASPRWRTWSFTRLAKKPGTYDVVVYDAKGEEIGRTDFEVVDAKAPVPTAAADPYEDLEVGTEPSAVDHNG